MMQVNPDRAGYADMLLMVRAFQISKMIQVAAALDIPDRLALGPRSASSLAEECGADPNLFLRLCRALAAFGIFTVDAKGVVDHSPRSQWLRRDAQPTLYHAARYWTTPGNWTAWAGLEKAIRTGISPFKAVHGQMNFEYLSHHPEEAALFDLFMQHSPDDRHAAVAEAYDFSDAGLVVDVGGGNGALLAAILKVHPSAAGLLFDQHAVVSGAPETLKGFESRSRVEGGDFFERVPRGGDVYTLSQILHDWSDERCLAILRNCRAAMYSRARLLVIERVLEEEPGLTNPMNYLADINMMVLHDGAKERTQAEFARLFEQTGLTMTRVVATRSPFSIVEAVPV